ncbi:MAG: hypothetical protein ACPG5P_06435 [Saprospiraceae bacterium]
MSKNTTVISGQSLFDISLNEYGTISFIFDFAKSNGISIIDSLSVGQNLSVPDSDNIDTEVRNYYKEHNVNPATGDISCEPFGYSHSYHN